MTLHLTDQQEAIIERLVASGRFTDANHVLSEALIHLEDYERQLDELRAKIQVGRDDVARGAIHEYTPELREQIRQAARRRVRNGKRPSADVLP